jgi:hypothetical protein
MAIQNCCPSSGSFDKYWQLRSHHADDTKVYLPDLQEGTVQHLLQGAHRFGQAAGRFVNPLKSSAIPLCGISCPTLGNSVAGVQIVGEANSLAESLWAWLSSLWITPTTTLPLSTPWCEAPASPPLRTASPCVADLAQRQPRRPPTVAEALKALDVLRH